MEELGILYCLDSITLDKICGLHFFSKIMSYLLHRADEKPTDISQLLTCDVMGIKNIITKNWKSLKFGCYCACLPTALHLEVPLSLFKVIKTASKSQIELRSRFICHSFIETCWFFYTHMGVWTKPYRTKPGHTDKTPQDKTPLDKTPPTTGQKPNSFIM